MLVFDALGDRVDTWTTLNEPWCSAMLGYAYGVHAPGRRDFAAGIHAVHHLLLGHGLATARLRAAATRPMDLGITLNLGTAKPATDSRLDREAARRADGLGLRMYLDPLVHGRYPDDLVADLAARGASPSRSRTATSTIIATPFDVLGVNYYQPACSPASTRQGTTADGDGPAGRSGSCR